MGDASTRRVPPAARWLVAGGIAGAILVASVLPRPPGVVPPMGLGPLGLVGAGWWLHALAYAALAASLLSAIATAEGSPVAAVPLALGLAVVFGLAIEVVQAPLATRRFEVADLVANAVGATAAAVVWWLARRRPGVA